MRISRGYWLTVMVIGLLGGCGGGSDGGTAGGTGGGGGSSGSGGTASRNVYGECPSSDSSGGGEVCTGEEAYDRCIMSECSAELETALGPAYATGKYAGACGDTMRCVVGCACGDSRCELACFSSAPESCLTAYQAVETCMEESACPEPVCTPATGSGGTTGSGGSDSGGTTGSGGEVSGGARGGGGSSGVGGAVGDRCPYSVATLDCTAACSNLKALAAKCQSDSGVPVEVQAVLTVAAQGNGAACRTTCAANSPAFTAQWGCFQGVPVAEPCSAIAGCTIVNCP